MLREQNIPIVKFPTLFIVITMRFSIEIICVENQNQIYENKYRDLSTVTVKFFGSPNDERPTLVLMILIGACNLDLILLVVTRTMFDICQLHDLLLRILEQSWLDLYVDENESSFYYCRKGKRDLCVFKRQSQKEKMFLLNLIHGIWIACKWTSLWAWPIRLFTVYIYRYR